jgi:large subunit ribosomal protein L29
MAKFKTKEFRELPPDTLSTKVAEMESELFNLRFQGSMGKLENSSMIRAARRDIARAKTVLKEKSAKQA